MDVVRLIASLALVAAAPACGDDPFSPPPGTVEFAPPPDYRIAWQQVENCSGLQGDFNRVHWFLVPLDLIPCAIEGGQCEGLWQEPHNIYLSQRAYNDIVFYFTVQHEILHDLLGPIPGHPPVFETCHLLRR